MKIILLRRKIVVKFLIIAILILGTFVWTKYDKEDIISVFNNSKELPIYCVDTEKKQVAISFDAAWGDQYSREILDILDEYNIKTTFFLVEFWADKYPELVKEIHNRGHEIGNHSANHPKMSQLSKEQITKELKETEKTIENIIGERTILFRPPFGDYNDRLINTCRENGYYVIQWDVDSLDWRELGVQPVVDRVTKNVNNGSIILFHNNAKYVTEYLPIVLKKLKSNGYEIVPISKLIYKDNFYINTNGRQIKKN
ncbi:MAG: polysaccharide deacetylase family sporulation protein PdaB [Firmicutes bacterium]|nr:polysaccharide deacetylase family sporulation protein PdaB [Bacillota bacterium]